jgi:hypothetical protein
MEPSLWAALPVCYTQQITGQQPQGMAQYTLHTRGPAGDFFMNFIFQEMLLVSYIIEKLRTSAFQPCKKQILIVNLAENIRFLVLENFPR